jgi:hypothetical protein
MILEILSGALAGQVILAPYVDLPFGQAFAYYAGLKLLTPFSQQDDMPEFAWRFYTMIGHWGIAVAVITGRMIGEILW